MAAWSCPHCNAVIGDVGTDTVEDRKTKANHTKKCREGLKKAFGWPVPVVGGEFCCPYRYRGCLYSAGFDCISRHCSNHSDRIKTCLLGPGLHDTAESIYADLEKPWLGPALGKFVEETFAEVIKLARNAPRGQPPAPLDLNAGVAHAATELVNCTVTAVNPDRSEDAVSGLVFRMWNAVQGGFEPTSDAQGVARDPRGHPSVPLNGNSGDTHAAVELVNCAVAVVSLDRSEDARYPRCYFAECNPRGGQASPTATCCPG
ncbi:hypothetical protein M405DRAFT_74785 [Rhizopogon salebrosus TDB-379]|nr:hypothetical protein M405DRAFT_74785 [Rhizopogon salebrosus TDB-379]